MKVDVLVEIYQGVLEGVRVLSSEKAKEAWEKWGKKHGYENYEAFLKDLEEGCPDHELRWFTDIKVEGA